MPKTKKSSPDQYQKAVFISFLADGRKGKTDYSFYDSDGEIPKVKSAFMYPKEDRRGRASKDPDTGEYIPDDGHKKLKERRIPFIDINFLYQGKKVLYGKPYDIDDKKTNYQVAEELFKEGLKDLKKDSIIYINGHGNPDTDSITSRLMMGGEFDPNYESSVTYEQMADILAKHVPESAKKGLTIKLTACEPTKFANGLMCELNQRGFSQTKVIAYNEILLCVSQLDTSTNTYVLFDQFVESRKHLQHQAAFLHGKHLPSSKTVWYNELIHGEQWVTQKDYREYKDELALAQRDKIPKTEELHDLIDRLKDQLNTYLRRHNEGENGFSIFNRHGTSGSKRVEELFANLNHIDRRIERRVPEESARLILKELRDFSNKEGNYSEFSGRISTNKNSGMTYIVRGMQSFYDQHQDGGHIKSLKGFQTPFLTAFTSASEEISTTDAANAKEVISQLAI